MARELRDSVVVITVASSGIGRAAALQFAGEGARVVLASRNKSELNVGGEKRNSHPPFSRCESRIGARPLAGCRERVSSSPKDYSARSASFRRAALPRNPRR